MTAKQMLTKLKTAAIECAHECPGATGLAIYALVSFIIVCLYWQFGTNDWVKIGLAPGWILSVAGLMQVALMVDRI